MSKAERVKLLKFSNTYQPLRKRKKNAKVSEKKTPLKEQKKLSSETNDDSDDSEVNDSSDGSKSSDSSDESSSSEDEDDGANIGIIPIFSYNLFSFISHRYFFDQIYYIVLFVDATYIYTDASKSNHPSLEGYWSHIGKTIFDLEDGLFFTILGVCTSNFHSDLFFKYIDCNLYNVDQKKKIKDKECEYSLCKEIMNPKLYEFKDTQVNFF